MYDFFLVQLDLAWEHCERILVEGGRICCVVGDVCIPRRRGRHRVMPLHSDIQVRVRRFGLDTLTPILWHKIANGVTEVEGNGAGFYGKPYQPGAVVKNDIEHILFLRKPGNYRKTTMLQKALSMLTKKEMQCWFSSIWSDIRGASTRSGHPAPYPIELAERLIRMFSFAGDSVLDPFLGTGSTTVAAIRAGRNSIGVELEPKYLEIARERAQMKWRRSHYSVPRKRRSSMLTSLSDAVDDLLRRPTRMPDGSTYWLVTVWRLSSVPVWSVCAAARQTKLVFAVFGAKRTGTWPLFGR